MAALVSDWLRHFRLLLWNRWTEFNETWQEARSQSPLPSLCLSGGSEKQDGRPSLWLAETFSTSPLKPLNRIQQNLIGSKISKPSTKFVFFGPIRKRKWPPRPLIGWDIFDFPVETAERNSTNLDRKQDLNVLYQVCVFRADRKNKMAARPLIGWDIFDFSVETTERNSTNLDSKQDFNAFYQVCVFGADRKTRWPPGLWFADIFSTSSLKPLNGIQRNLTGSKISTPSTKFVFLGRSKKQDGRPGLWFAETFSTSPLKQLNPNSMKLDRKQDLNALYQVCVFWAYQKNKMAALASDWLRLFRLLLWKRWTEFSETWQEASSQCLLPRLFFFSGKSGKNKMAALASDWLRHFRLLLWNCERNSTKLDRKQDLNALY